MTSKPILVLAALVAAACAPSAVADETRTISSFEEIHQGTDGVYPFTVTEEEAGKPRAVIFRNAPGSPFGIVVYNSSGEEAWSKNGSRGVQTLPPMAPGDYRFFIRGTGTFQVTDKFLDRVGKASVERVLNLSTTLQGTDAYVLAPTTNWTVDFTGSIEIEWFELVGGTQRVSPPVNLTAKYGVPYIITIRGEEGTPYTIGFTEVAMPDEPSTQASGNDTPGPGATAALAALAAAAFVVARVRRRT